MLPPWMLRRPDYWADITGWTSRQIIDPVRTLALNKTLQKTFLSDSHRNNQVWPEFLFRAGYERGGRNLTPGPGNIRYIQPHAAGRNSEGQHEQ